MNKKKKSNSNDDDDDDNNNAYNESLCDVDVYVFDISIYVLYIYYNNSHPQIYVHNKLHIHLKS